MTRQQQLEALCKWLAEKPCLREYKDGWRMMGPCKPKEKPPIGGNRNTCQTCWARYALSLSEE